MGGREGHLPGCEYESFGEWEILQCSCFPSAASAGVTKKLSGVPGADTSSAESTVASGPGSESGSAESQPSKSGSARTGERRTARTKRQSATPPSTVPPDLEAEAEALLGDKSALYSLLKKNLLVHYLIEAEAGANTNVNPQHSRASRKQAKELAELLARLTADDPTNKK